MVCQVCHEIVPGREPVCIGCRRTLRPAPDRVLPGGIRLMSAFIHEGTARTLVHQLKYRGVTGYVDLVAAVLADRLPGLDLVPVPRPLSRRIRYGVDPSRELARALAKRMNVEVVNALRPPIHASRRAGGDHTRQVRLLSLRFRPSAPVLIVDDVVTTGATLNAAISTIGSEMVTGAVCANSARQVSSLPDPAPITLQ